MLDSKKTETNIGVGVGLLLNIIARILLFQGFPSILVILIGLAGTAVFVWGCMAYAEGKGQSRWLGLLGLFSCFGLIILVFMKDHYKDGRRTKKRRRGQRDEAIDEF